MKQKIGVLGSGDVAQTLAKGFKAKAYDVRIGTRDPGKLASFSREAGVPSGSFQAVADHGDLIVLAVKGTAALSVLEMAGAAALAGKVVIDTTNPLDFSAGMPPKLAVSGNDSGGERVQRLLPDAHVVKAFNTVGNAFMFRPSFPGGPPDMFFCGNDADAKQKVATILKDFGWGIVDVGGIESSRYLEAMCLVWVLSAIQTNSWNQAFKLLKK